MNVLLLSMPDSFEHMPSIVIRMPNGALASLAGNIDSHHRVSVADLILVQRKVRETVAKLVQETKPDVVGLSVMTFQRMTALKIISFIRSLIKPIHIVIGGYDPSLAPEAYASGEVDFIVRGEGELTFQQLLRAIESRGDYAAIPGLSFWKAGRFHHNADRSVSKLAENPIRLPNRNARVLKGYTMLGRQVDIVETSRGCTFDCSFCSIVEMRGQNFHTYSIDRVIADIRDAQAHGARMIFLVDDNITLNVPRMEALCQAIIDAGLNSIDYTVQAMTSAMANHGEHLAPLMRKAGFRYVFLGIENILEKDLEFLKAVSKNMKREDGKKTNATIRAIEYIHRNKMYVVGGLIVGNPDDTRDSIEVNLEFARKYVDWPYIQHPTPYPRTAMTKDFHSRDLVLTQDTDQYDGTTAVVRTEHMSGDEVEFMRWKAERWMKLRHFPKALRHDPLFIARNGHRMLAHTFRGSTLKSLLGMEDERRAFERYREIHRAERVYL